MRGNNSVRRREARLQAAVRRRASMPPKPPVNQVSPLRWMSPVFGRRYARRAWWS